MLKASRAIAVAGLLVALAAGCGEECTAAQQTCVDGLVDRYGDFKAGLVKVDGLAETSSSALTKVEGTVVYRPDAGAGERVETAFVCQVTNGEVTLLEVRGD